MSQRVLVTGSKKNQQTILDSTEWDSIKAHQASYLAGDAFDKAVTEFFAPIVEAAEKVNAALAELNSEPAMTPEQEAAEANVRA